MVDAPLPDRPVAFLGLRACDLAAIAIQDRVFLGGAAEDRVYASARQDAMVVAVECAAPAATCFCTSMGGGPEVQAGADVVLTELLDGEHRFLAQAETDVGRDLLARLAGTAAGPPRGRGAARDRAAGGTRTGSAVTSTPRACTTCCSATSSTRAGTTSPSGAWPAGAARSCARLLLHGGRGRHGPHGCHGPTRPAVGVLLRAVLSHAGPGSVRSSTRARYRQWLTHKLATWVDQFDSSGCVGCGRCITWCPAGIDITEEVAAIGSP